MTDDKELIARLRSMHWCVTTKANGVGVSDEAVAPEAADRIEALTAKLAECEARLGKAVEALHNAAFQLDWCQAAREISKEIDATLAEIKSGVATTPYGLEGEIP